MRVAAYTHLHRALNPTGVGHHMIQMVRGLHGTPGVQLTVIAPQNQLDRAGRIPNRNALAGIPARGLPLDRRWLEHLWERLDAPKADRWCQNPDWIYTPTEAYVATRSARFAVTVHDLHAFEPGLPWSNTPSHRSLRRRWTAMFRPIVRRADRILAASEFTRRRLVELLGARDDRITIVGNGVDQAFFAASAENQIAHAIRQNIVVIGGLTRRKGGDLVLRVARELRHHLPDLRVVVAGVGENEFDAAASELNNVVRLGFVPEAELVRLLQGALAMMFLSRYEGFGIPVLEAMAVGIPVIASRFAALPEVVGDAGLLLDAEEPREVAAAIETLSRDERAWSELSARGRKRAEAYRWERCVERLVEALRSA